MSSERKNIYIKFQKIIAITITATQLPRLSVILPVPHKFHLILLQNEPSLCIICLLRIKKHTIKFQKIIAMIAITVREKYVAPWPICSNTLLCSVVLVT